MRNVLNTLLGVCITVFLGACASGRAANATVESVQAYVNSKAAGVAILDVNDAETRISKGVIPGAIQLSSYDSYAFAELPADKKHTLIFYCYNTLCPASGIAADRAIDNGYTDVRVMKAGIVGWKDATAKITAMAAPTSK